MFFKKEIVEDEICPICYKEVETISHVLWSCPIANDVWAERQSLFHKWSSSNMDFVNLWEKLQEKFKPETLEEKAVIFRGLWHRRNKYIFENLVMLSKLHSHILKN